METIDAGKEGRIAGGAILVTTLMSVLLMMHHPTSHGPDDGLLLADWSNRTVHGGMILCILGLVFGGSSLARCLGDQHASVRAGALAYTAGMIALAAAALVNGFVVSGIIAAAPDAATARLQAAPFGVLNQVLAVFGMALIGTGLALWGIRMLRLTLVTRVAGGLGIALAGLAGWWLIVGQGAFGLYPAMIAVLVFAVWSLIVAVQMLRRAI